MKIIGAIIAGGRSSRMGGREKAFLELASKPVILHVIEQFEPQVDQLVINANGDAARFSEFGLEVVPDALSSLTTPLAGLHAALVFTKKVEAKMLVTVFCFCVPTQTQGRPPGPGLAAPPPTSWKSAVSSPPRRPQ